MTWTAATDNGPSGVDGYAYVFTTTSSPSCDQTKDIEETATEVTSPSLAAGDYWFHICTRDNAGIWTSTASAGPFTINSPPPPSITLSALGYKIRGLQQADLSWSGAITSNVDIYRNGIHIATTANDGLHTDNINRRGSGSYTYQVCEAGTSNCSNTATVNF